MQYCKVTEMGVRKCLYTYVYIHILYIYSILKHCANCFLCFMAKYLFSAAVIITSYFFRVFKWKMMSLKEL